MEYNDELNLPLGYYDDTRISARRPDFISFEFSFEGFGVSKFGVSGGTMLTVDRYDNYYETSVVSAGINATPISASYLAGWILIPRAPYEDELIEFLEGTSRCTYLGPGPLTRFVGFGMNKSALTGDKAVLVGIMTPQAEVALNSTLLIK